MTAPLTTPCMPCDGLGQIEDQSRGLRGEWRVCPYCKGSKQIDAQRMVEIAEIRVDLHAALRACIGHAVIASPQRMRTAVQWRVLECWDTTRRADPASYRVTPIGHEIAALLEVTADTHAAHVAAAKAIAAKLSYVQRELLRHFEGYMPTTSILAFERKGVIRITRVEVGSRHGALTPLGEEVVRQLEPTKTVFRCTFCGHISTGRIPRSGREVGDGTCRYPRRHKLGDQVCEGVFREAEWLDVPCSKPVAGDPHPTRRNRIHGRRS